MENLYNKSKISLFFSGMSSILNIFPEFENIEEDSENADAKSFEQDAIAIGGYFAAALDKFRKETGYEAPPGKEQPEPAE